MRHNNKSEFEKEWIKIFCNGIDENELKEHVLSDGNFIWHIFSWQLIPNNTFLEGEEAREAFDAQDKTNAIYFEPWLGRKEDKPIGNLPLAKDLDLRLECYVMSIDKTWTYIKTHEYDSCGPYFYKLSNKKNEK